MVISESWSCQVCDGVFIGVRPEGGLCRDCRGKSTVWYGGRCDYCGHEWISRDPIASCPECSSDEVTEVFEAGQVIIGDG
jgi:Zn finger protein HypA/HybF involved in hydrogenase expression